MSVECESKEVGFIPCRYHFAEPESKCLLAFCLDCGKDLYRECERDGE